MTGAKASHAGRLGSRFRTAVPAGQEARTRGGPLGVT